MTKKTVYIPTNGEQTYMVCYTSDSGDDYLPEEPVTQVEAYVFTDVELTQLLERYTQRVIQNVILTQIKVLTDDPKEGEAAYSYFPVVDKEAIKRQLPEFLKEIEL